METTRRTEAEYFAAISRVVRFIQSSLDEVVTPRQLARLAGFSPHHFHRIFRAVVGESVMDFVRRLRLERAAHRLKTGDDTVGAISFDAGYGSQEAFARIFQIYFGLPPSEYRLTPLAPRIPSASDIHYEPGGSAPLRWVADADLISEEGLCELHRGGVDPRRIPAEEIGTLLVGLSTFVYSKPETEPTMNEATTEIDREIEALEKEVEAAKQRLSEARHHRPHEPVSDYAFLDWEGNEVHLSDLFGDKDDLIVIHNMGTGCPACTMWADGFSGLAPHLSDRASFVVSSPDKPEVQKRFAQKRNWSFRMVSAHGNRFFQDMGFWSKGPWPGVSTFRRQADGTIVRIGRAVFDDGDDFCAVWPLFDLLQDGANGWQPKYGYDES